MKPRRIEKGARSVEYASTAGLLGGAVLLIATFVFADVRQHAFWADRWVKAAFVAGTVLVVGGLIAKLPALRRGLGRRRAAAGANAAAGVSLALALTVLVLLIAEHRFVRIDLTGGRRFSLSTATARFLGHLKGPVRFTVLYDRQDPNAALIPMVMDTLSAYRSVGHDIEVRRIDSADVGNRTALQQLAARLGGVELYANCIVVEYGGRHRVVEYSEMLERGATGPGRTPGFRGEEALTGALVGLVEGRERLVLAVTGHGERPLKGLSPADLRKGERVDPLLTDAFSLSGLVSKLSQENYRTEPLDLLKTGTVPECALVLIAGPRTNFREEELDALRRYLAAGGRLLVMLDSELYARSRTNLQALLGEYGVTARTDVAGCATVGVTLGGRTVGRVVTLVPVAKMAEHPITTDLQGFRIDMPSPCALLVAERPDRPDLRVEPLLTSVDSAWGETSLENARYDAATDLAGPLTLGAVVEPVRAGAPGPRIVVLATSLGFTTGATQESPPLLYLARNAVNWLAGAPARLGIPPKGMDVRRAIVSRPLQRLARWLTLLMTPLAIVAVGIIVWRVRRGR